MEADICPLEKRVIVPEPLNLLIVSTFHEACAKKSGEPYFPLQGMLSPPACGRSLAVQIQNGLLRVRAGNG